MAAINNREFTQGQLNLVFSVLDRGGKRDDVRRLVRQFSNKGVSNETIRQLRNVHRLLRRSQGYDVKQGGTRGWLTDRNGNLLPPARQYLKGRFLSPAARPAGPQQVSRDVTVEYTAYDGGRPVGTKVAVFRVGPDTAPLSEQVAQASVREGYGSSKETSPIMSRRGFSPLHVKELA